MIVLLIMAIVFLVPRNKTPAQKISKFKVEYGVAAILLLAIVATYLYYERNRKMENEEMVAMAEHLLQKRDTDFENAFLRFATPCASEEFAPVPFAIHRKFFIFSVPFIVVAVQIMA